MKICSILSFFAISVLTSFSAFASHSNGLAPRIEALASANHPSLEYLNGAWSSSVDHGGSWVGAQYRITNKPTTVTMCGQTPIEVSRVQSYGDFIIQGYVTNCQAGGISVNSADGWDLITFN